MAKRGIPGVRCGHILKGYKHSGEQCARNAEHTGKHYSEEFAKRIGLAVWNCVVRCVSCNDSSSGRYCMKPECRRAYEQNERDRDQRNADRRALGPDFNHKHHSRRRARKAAVPHEDWTRADVIELYGDACYLCGGPYEHTDHVIPLSRGGYDVLANLRPCCSPCNLSKHAKLPPVIVQAKVWFESDVLLDGYYGRV